MSSPLASANQFERCRGWLESALEPENTIEEVAADLAANRAMLWPGERCALITRITFDPDKTLHVWLGGGDLDELLAMRTGVEAVGRLMGCRFATIAGRKGWARVFRKFGFEAVDDVLRKAL